MSEISYNSTITASTCKSERHLCRCCHAEGVYKSLYKSYFLLDIGEVVYFDMLRDILGVQMITVKEPMLCTICDECIQKLLDVRQFKQQVVKREEHFRNLYFKHIAKDELEIIKDVEVKQELPDPEEASGEKDASFDCDINSAAVDDDDFRPSDPEDDFQFKLEEEQKPKGGKKTKCKKDKKETAETKTKTKKKTAPKKEKKQVPDDQVVETLAGVIKVEKHPTSIRLEEGVDYNKVGDAFMCCKCDDRKYQLLSSLQKHVKNTHLKIPRFTCPEPGCSLSFPGPSSFTIHKLEVHNIDDRIKCNACDGYFNSKLILKSHMNTFHKLGMRRKCADCDYECFSVQSLRRHRLKHKTVKDYHCNYCKKSFVRRGTWVLHEKIHTGDRRKVCKVCGQAFVQKASLNYHMAKHHPDVDF